jgi:bifunctional non-homologous end joining protein LigD
MPARDTLEAYRKRRDFSRTPEPAGQARRGQSSWSYVIQKHAARRLHFDFRLELDGVLKSWAVTRGPSLDPADRRLAVRTEDHPLDYGGFEGVIPPGEYGGGTVMLWDRGRWTPRADPREGLRKGHLKFELAGRRLKGGFALVRMRPDEGRGAAARENWLLIKEDDRYARRDQDPVVRWTRSVASGRVMETIARAADRVHTSVEALRFVAPQLATLASRPPEGPDWLHEIKFDGYRAVIAVAGRAARIYSRSGQDWTGRYGALGPALARLRARDALLDGEIVVPDDEGFSRFSLLQRALKDGDADFLLMAFDLLRLDGKDLRPLPLLERKRRLRALLEGLSDDVRYCDHEVGQGGRIFAEACRLGLEGIVSKRIDLPYVSGRTRTWIKTKCGRRDEFVIGGYRPSSVKGRPFSSLLIGEFADGELCYRGRVGTGFDGAWIAELGRRLRALERKTSPFRSVPRLIERQARWVTPRLVAEIAYTERTADGVLRHPSFQGLREDKPAREVGGGNGGSSRG